MFKNPFSFEGRIRRSEFGISLIIYAIAYAIVFSLSAASGSDGGPAIFLICAIPMLWFLWAQGAKRCHDVNNSGWWQLIPFYIFWMIFGYEFQQYIESSIYCPSRKADCCREIVFLHRMERSVDYIAYIKDIEFRFHRMKYC